METWFGDCAIPIWLDAVAFISGYIMFGVFTLWLSGHMYPDQRYVPPTTAIVFGFPVWWFFEIIGYIEDKLEMIRDHGRKYGEDRK